MPQLKKLFPKHIENYFEPFCGGGSSFINTHANYYFLNDIDPNIIRIHKFLGRYANDRDVFFNKLFAYINFYELSCSYKGITVPDEFKRKFKKTYYSHYNKKSYLKSLSL